MKHEVYELTIDAGECHECSEEFRHYAVAKPDDIEERRNPLVVVPRSLFGVVHARAVCERCAYELGYLVR